MAAHLLFQSMRGTYLVIRFRDNNLKLLWMMEAAMRLGNYLIL